MSRRRGRVRAPELAGRGGWINTQKPLSLAALKGKVILLDFWTFCCINCLHVLDELRPLEERFQDELVVIGVHSPKFEHERDHDALLRAVARYDVRHPVLDDPDRTTWEQYGIRAWPTLVLIDPEGYAVAAVSGEGNAAALGRVIEEMVREHRAAGTLNENPLQLLPAAVPSGPLRFPGKVAGGPGGLFAVTDSGHNRVVVARLEEGGAALEAVAGSGARGMEDGPLAGTRFTDPQGILFLNEDTLLVADTGNHLIRRIDLRTRQVETVAGTGSQARWGASGGAARRTPLNSPWDLELWEGRVAIAMAGPHQLWYLDLEREEVGILAGSGMEDIMDGPALQAAMAQPSGVSSDGERLWVADSETSSLRALDRLGYLRTYVGQGLFDFGYVDGPADIARLQHPLGVLAVPGGPVVICDTYNSALRSYDTETSKLATLNHGDLDEPSGAALIRKELLVADTNNHRLVQVSLEGGGVSAFEIRGLQAPDAVSPKHPDALEIGPLELAPELELTATMPIPEGEKLDASLGPAVQLTVRSDMLPEGEVHLTSNSLPAEVTLKLDYSKGGEGYLDVQLQVGTCQEGPGAVCYVSERRWQTHVLLDPGGSPRLNLGLAP